MSLFDGDDRSSSPAGERILGWLRPEWPTQFRRFMGWIFLAACLQYAVVSLRSISYKGYQQGAPPSFHSLLVTPAFSLVAASVFGVAWWTIWKVKSSARGWAIAASLMEILAFLRQFIVPLREVWGMHVGALIIGIVGLVAFLWPESSWACE